MLLDAAFELLGTEGWTGTTVRGVCAAAELNPRYFYENFENLDALAVAAYERMLGELREAVAAALDAAPDDVPAQLRAGIAATVGFIDNDRRRARLLFVEALGSEALNRRRVAAGYELMSDMLSDARRRQHGAPDDDPIGVVTAAALVGGLSEALMAWIDGRIDMGRRQLVDDLSAMFEGLVTQAGVVAASRQSARRRR